MAAKLKAIGGALLNYGYTEHSVLEEEHCLGFGPFLGEVEDDLLTIFKALYGEKCDKAT